MHNIPIYFPIIALYAETHFRFFKGFPSLLFKREPEVVFDVPHRCGSGLDLPILLIINDIDKFNAKLLKVDIVVSEPNNPPVLHSFSDPTQFILQHPLSHQSSVFVFTLERSKLPIGNIYVNCKATLQVKKRTVEVLNDNFFLSSKLPFSCLITNDTLPASNYCSYGDVHIHSQYSQSHVEFGPPVQVIDKMAHTNGLDFYAVTDHSYDLACSMHDYLKNDNDLPRWKSFCVDAANSDYQKHGFIAGEEITCYNSSGKSVHICALNMQTFIPGSADGARRNKLITMSLKEVVKLIKEEGGISIAAHPGSKSGFLQRYFLNRGFWSQSDMSLDIDAVQAVNNGFGKSWEAAKKLWIKELLNGHALPLVAGNDSHGDFNRYRYIKIPFVSIAEDFTRYLSCSKTGLYHKTSAKADVMREIKRGATFVTNGPFLGLSASESMSDSIIQSEKICKEFDSIFAVIESSYEFGAPYQLNVFRGNLRENAESLLYSKTYNDNQYKLITPIPLPKFAKDVYLRAEVTCRMNTGKTTFAATSACFFKR